MKSKYRKIGGNIRDKIGQEFEINDMRIYGSCARDRDTEDSDIDLYIELNETSPAIKKRVKEIVWQESLRNGRLISVLLFSKHEAEKSPLRSSSILNTIKSEGVRV